MKLTTVTPSTKEDLNTGSSPHQPEVENTSIGIEELANTAEVDPSTSTPSDSTMSTEGIDDDDALLGEEHLLTAHTPPKRSGPQKDLAKHPIATTLAVTILSLGVVGGLALMWWGLSAAKGGVSATKDAESIEEVLEDAKQKEIEALQQQLYQERANVALKDLAPEEDTDEGEAPAEVDDSEDDQTPTVATSPAPPPPPRRSTPIPPPPPPRRVAPTPVRSASSRSTSSTSPSAPAQPNYDSPSQWMELATLGQVGVSDFDTSIPIPQSAIDNESDAIATGIEETVIPSSGGWYDTGIAMVTVSGGNNTPWPNGNLQDGEISQGEIGILERQPVTPPTPTDPPPTSLEAPPPDTALLASAKSDPWKTAASAYSDMPDSDTIVYNADDFWDVDEDWNEPGTMYEQTATVAIGTIAKAKVITPIIWDMEALRATDGIFTIELTEAMEGLNGEIVLPEGTRLIGDVSHVTSVGHVYQSIVGIHLPNGQQIPVPVIDHEAETGAPITPLVVRGKKGEALIADAVERSDGNRNSLANDLLIGAVNGLAASANNALEPDTSVQVNQGFGGSTVESQSNVNDPQAAFARGFLESTAHRMEERLYEETEEILVFQVDAGEKVSVVVNGLMSFSIPAEGWPE